MPRRDPARPEVTVHSTTSSSRYAVALASALLLAGCGGAGVGQDWYYHFACNGDSACLTTNPLPSGTPFGTLDEGPVESNCRSLQEFRSRFWGAQSRSTSRA
jgi:hypothetical protein